MYFSAGALAGFEIIVLIILQSTAGNIYQMTGLIIAGLMTGLALGSGFEWTLARKYPLLINSFFLILFYAVMALIVNRVLGIEIKTGRYLADSFVDNDPIIFYRPDIQVHNREQRNSLISFRIQR